MLFLPSQHLLSTPTSREKPPEQGKEVFRDAEGWLEGLWAAGSFFHYQQRGLASGFPSRNLGEINLLMSFFLTRTQSHTHAQS